MELIEKNKSEILLGFLFIESLLLSLLVGSAGTFWALFAISVATAFFYVILKFNVHPARVLADEHRYDIFLVVVMTAMLNANISIISNRIILLAILLAYFYGLRYLIGTFIKGTLNQVQRNSLNLAVLLTIFLGGNLITNLSMILERNIGGLAAFPSSALLFMLVYLLSFYNFVKSKVARKRAKVYAAVLALILSEVALLSGFYLEKYPNIYNSENAGNIAIATAPLFMVVIYYLLYGLLIHKVEKRIYPKLILEYIGVASVIIITLFITIKWLG